MRDGDGSRCREQVPGRCGVSSEAGAGRDEQGAAPAWRPQGPRRTRLFPCVRGDFGRSRAEERPGPMKHVNPHGLSNENRLNGERTGDSEPGWE